MSGVTTGLLGLVLDHGGVLDDLGQDGRSPVLDAALHLRVRGVRTAVLSDAARGELDEARLAGQVDVVAVSGRTGLPKPGVAAYLDVAKRLGLAPGDCVMVDDRRVNVSGAVAAGMVGVLHESPAATLAELEVLFRDRW